MAVPDRSFFEVAAQVVPLLAITGLLERSRDEEANDAVFDAATRLVMWTALLVAEVTALAALAGTPTHRQRQVVIAGLALGGMALVQRVGDRELRALARTGRWRRLRVTVFAAYAMISLGILIGVTIGAVL